MLPTADLTSLMRSCAMLSSGQSIPVDRDQLYQLCEEVLETRQLLQRFGSDLRSVAAHAPRITNPQG